MTPVEFQAFSNHHLEISPIEMEFFPKKVHLGPALETGKFVVEPTASCPVQSLDIENQPKTRCFCFFFSGVFGDFTTQRLAHRS